MNRKYSKNIYSEHAINFSIESFKDICEIRVGWDNEYWLLQFEKFDGDKCILVKEFDNYLIDSMNKV